MCGTSSQLTDGVHAQAFAELLTPKTKIVALVHVSNVLGNVLDADYVVEQAHKVGVLLHNLAATSAVVAGGLILQNFSAHGSPASAHAGLLRLIL